MPHEEFMGFSEEKNTLSLLLRMFINFEKSEIKQTEDRPYFQFFVKFVNAIYQNWKDSEEIAPEKKVKLTADHFIKQLNDIDNKFKFLDK